MQPLRNTLLACLAGLGLTAVACGDDDAGDGDGRADAAPDPDAQPGADAGTADAEPPASGLVFALTNDVSGNEVIAFRRKASGALVLLGSFPTGGLGSGGGLGSQGAVVLSEDREHLFAVNAGSRQVSSLRIYDDHVALADISDSGGERPVSVTVRGERLYVLNGAGAGGLMGFALDGGTMIPIAGSEMPLSGADTTAPAQIQLSPDGALLVVTEKATNNFDTYRVGDDGTLSGQLVIPSVGQTPFGFEFSAAGTLIVSEAFGGAPGASAASSYDLQADGTLDVISSSVVTGETAACWVAIADRAQVAYTTNTGSNTISGYAMSDDGSLALIDDGITAALGDGRSPIDMTIAGDEEFLYVLNAATDTISSFAIGSDGGLTAIGSEIAVPPATVGLIGY